MDRVLHLDAAQQYALTVQLLEAFEARAWRDHEETVERLVRRFATTGSIIGAATIATLSIRLCAAQGVSPSEVGAVVNPILGQYLPRSRQA